MSPENKKRIRNYKLWIAPVAALAFGSLMVPFARADLSTCIDNCQAELTSCEVGCNQLPGDERPACFEACGNEATLCYEACNANN